MNERRVAKDHLIAYMTKMMENELGCYLPDFVEEQAETLLLCFEKAMEHIKQDPRYPMLLEKIKAKDH